MGLAISERRRRHRRRRRLRRLRRAGLAALAVVLLVGAVVAILARGALAAREDLRAAETAMDEVVAALQAGDTSRAEAAVGAAAESIASARDRTSGPLWRLTGRLPAVGRTPVLVDRLLGVAEASVAVAAGAAEHAAALLAASGDQIEVTEGEVDLGAIEAAHLALEEIPVGRLERSRERLASSDATLVPGQLADARRRALRMADRAIGTATDARSLLEVLPGFLGRDGTRRYLLGIQTSAEVRGTGGLLGYVGILTVADGRMQLANEEVVDLIDAEGETVPLGQIGGRVDNPVPVPDEFANRYDFTDARSFFAHVNVDPDLPTTAPVVLDLYERYTGQAVDGLLLFDPWGLSEVLTAIGPVEVPAAALDEAGRLPAVVEPEAVPAVTMIDIYDVFGAGRSAERGAYFAGLSRSAFEQVFAGSWDALDVGRRLGAAAAGRHVQVYSRDRAEQAVFEQVGVAGQMPAVRDRDLLAVTANNAVGGKQDVHLGQSLTADIDLGEVFHRDTGVVARRTVSAEVGIDNPLPASGRDPYIIGNCAVSEDVSNCFEGPPGWNRTWFTVWTPVGSNPVEVEEGGESVAITTTDIHGHRGVDHFLYTPPGDSNAFEVTYDGAVALRRDAGDLLYELVVWRQSKGIPDRLDLTISPPDGWDLAEVTVDGGGDGAGLGPNGEPGPAIEAEIERQVEAGVDGARVRVRGDASADVRVTIRFGRPTWDRLVDWLRTPAL